MEPNTAAIFPKILSYETFIWGQIDKFQVAHLTKINYNINQSTRKKSMPKYEILTTMAFTASTYAHPTELPEVVHWNDPALSVMIDFTQNKPPLISPETPIVEVLEEMKVHGVHVMLVVDQEEEVIGLISAEDILGEKPIQLIEERGLARDEILVAMVMLPETHITAFDIETLRHAKVGNVVNTLRELHQHYALVLKNEYGHWIVRGLFSSSQISKQLHTDLNIS
jgi:CBS domain-containing protein